MKTIKVTILKSDMPKSKYMQKLEIIDEFELPYDFINHIMQHDDEEISMQFKFNDVLYNHTLVKHPLDSKLISEEEAFNMKAKEAFTIVGDLIKMMKIPIDLNSPTSSNMPEQS